MVIIVFSLLFLVAVLRFVSQGRLLLKYSLLWLALGIVALVIALFPHLATFLARAFGFGLTSNFVFFVVLALLIVICVALTGIVSWQSRDIRSLIQQMALLKKDLEEEQEIHDSDNTDANHPQTPASE